MAWPGGREGGGGRHGSRRAGAARASHAAAGGVEGEVEVEVEEKEGEEEPPTGRAVLGPQGPCPSHLQSGEWGGGGGETTTGRPGAVALAPSPRACLVSNLAIVSSLHRWPSAHRFLLCLNREEGKG